MTTALHNAHSHTAPPPRRRRFRGFWITLAALTGFVVVLAGGVLELAIPPLAGSRIDGQGRRVFDLNLQQGQTEFVAGRPATTWGANGTYLGPTLRAARGENVLVNVRNGLDEPTTLGRLGDEILVNGTRGAHVDVAAERVRLRVLNASTARVFDFGFADDRSFQLVGSDGGLLARPHETRRVQLSPGEWAEVVVTMRPGERTVLRSYPPDLGTDFVTTRFGGGDDRLDILELRAQRDLRPAPAVPAVLAEIPRLNPADAVETRRFTLSGRTVNGLKMDPDRVDAAVTSGSTEIWEVANEDGTPHNFHVHGRPQRPGRSVHVPLPPLGTRTTG